MLRIFFLILLTISLCLNPNISKVQTGIKKIQKPNGKIILMATARASENAIRKNISTLKKVTSKEAALLLLKHELKKKKYKKIRTQFKIIRIEYSHDGEFCTIISEFYPD